MELLIASGNPKKLVEIEIYLKETGVRVLSPADVGGLPEVEEDGRTFAANAEKKAVSAATVSGRWALADDSGLEVDHLNGAPGVHSARFDGTHGDDDANNLRLLRELEEVEESDRGGGGGGGGGGAGGRGGEGGGGWEGLGGRWGGGGGGGGGRGGGAGRGGGGRGGG